MPSIRFTLLAAAMLAGSACTAAQIEQAQRVASATPCTPIESRAASVATQQPAFSGQTRACAVTSNVAHEVQVVTRALDRSWAVEPMAGGDFLVTEKAGRLRIVSGAGSVSEPIAGVLPVDARGQGGLLDVALSPSFASDRLVFWSFTEPRQGGNGTSIARGMLSADRRTLTDVRVIFRVLPTYEGTMHYGSRLAFGPDGMLYATFGERSNAEMRPYAQRLDSHLGKTIRIAPDGSVPRDNPFVGQANAQPEIWTVGHRNIQSAVFDAQGRFWTIEHGTRGGDEVNLMRRGRNYGWPVVAYGVEYQGGRINEGISQRAGMEQPVYYWDPVVAPSGAEWYTGSLFPAWRNSLFVGGLSSQRLVRLVIDGERVVGEEHLLVDRKKRIRDVRQGPDGALYVLTEERTPGAPSELLRVVPR